MSKLPSLFQTIQFISRHALNKSNKFRSILKFIKWQIAARLLKMKVVVPWVDNSKFIAGIGETGLTGNFYAGLMEYEDMAFMLHALDPSDTFVDVGANIGAYTILASTVVGSRSIAFEPLATTTEKLKDQISINRIDSLVDVRNMGVGDKPGALFFTNNNDTVNKVSIAGHVKNTSCVTVTTLDSELKDYTNLFIKIDVEGYEFNVLQGANQILSSNNVNAIIIELNGSGLEFGYTDEEIHKKIVSFNFTPVSYNPKERIINKISSYNKKGGNTIYLKDVEAIQARCQSAPTRKIHTAFGIRL